MNALTVSLVQMPITVGEVSQNRERAYARVAEAARRGSDLVVLPELWATGYDLEHATQHASPIDDGMFRTVAQWAHEFRLWLSGSLLERDGAAIYNTAYLASPDGRIWATYRKMHLFRPMGEHRFLRAGDHPTVVELPWGTVGLSICYDVRFPELFRAYALQGAHLVILPAEWPHPRLHHWRTLVQARAIENALFVLACNRVGTSGDTHFVGHSMVVSPWGEVLVEGGEQDVILTTSIHLDEVEQSRSRIPVLQDRRSRYEVRR